MTWRILKLSAVAAIAAASLAGNLPAGADPRPTAGSLGAEAKAQTPEAKSPGAEAKSPSEAKSRVPPGKSPATGPEAETTAREGSGPCLGRLMEILRSHSAA